MSIAPEGFTLYQRVTFEGVRESVKRSSESMRRATIINEMGGAVVIVEVDEPERFVASMWIKKA